jgi:hypothetical protein
MLIHDRKMFLTVIVAVSLLKLLLSAIAPVSFELSDIVRLYYSGQAPLGPWLALYPPLYLPWISRESVEVWLTSQPMAGPNTALLSLLFRLPTFAFDVATLAVVYLVGARIGAVERARLAGLIWYLNPYSLVSIELIGVPDVVAIFLLVLGLGLIMSRRLYPAAAILALGIWFKFFPVILIPPIFLFLSSQGFSRKRLVAALSITLLGLVGYLGWVLPSGLASLASYTPVTQPIPFILGAPVLTGTGYTVSQSAFGMFAFYCLLIFFAKRDTLIPTLISTLMLYYLLSGPYPQYFVWALPLMALDVVFANRSRILVVTAFFSLAFAQWFLISTAFLTPSGYSLLLIPIGVANPPSYLLGLRTFLEASPLLGAIILPLVYSSLFATILIYAIDAARSWFALPLPKAK